MSVRYLGICLVLLSLGCDQKKTGEPPADTATSGNIEFIADLDLQPVVDSLVAGFNAENSSAKVSVRYLPATEALDAMLQRKSRLVVIGRPLTAKERASLASQQVELVDFDMALNSVACIVSAKSSRTGMPIQELQDNILGTKSTYTQVLGSYLSSTEGVLDSIFLSDTATIKGKVVRYASVDSVIGRLRQDPEAVGYISSAWIRRIRADSTLRILDLIRPDAQGRDSLAVMLHPAYVYQGKYPLVSRIMGYTLEPPNTLPRGFLAYAMSANGQRVFLNYELVPRTQIIRLVPPKQ